MPMDAACLTAVVRECRPLVVGAKIDKIFQPGKEEIVLQLRSGQGNLRLLLTANPSHPRLQMTEVSRENPASPPMFCMLLRKHLTGGRIVAMNQPSMERMAELEIETRNELGDTVTLRLILEAMGRRSNLILVDSEGRITDCIHRVDGDLSRLRPVLPGMFYRLPPRREDKYDPLTLDLSSLRRLLEQAPGDRTLDRWLLDLTAGFSPLICRELAFRGTGAVDTRVCDLTDETRERYLWEVTALCADIRVGNAAPVALYEGAQPRDFSFLSIGQYGTLYERRSFPTFGALLDAFYGDRERLERVRQKGQSLLKTLNSARNRTARKLAAQRKELAATEEREQYRELGDILTSNLYQMRRGMTALRTVNFYDPEGAEIAIPLDPLLTPQQNAAKYYKRYNKAKTASVVLAEQIERGERELDYLDSVLESVQRAEGERDLTEIRQELEQSGYVKSRPERKGSRKQKKAPVTRPMEFRSTSGLRISVGRNNLQNDQLTCRKAYKSDLWLHTQKIHGAHVILWAEGREPDVQSITEAAMLAAYYSQSRDGENVPVDYTPVKYVRKPNGARPGMVIYTTYQTAYVTPDPALVERLRVK